MSMNWKTFKDVVETNNTVPKDQNDWPEIWKTIFHKRYDRSYKYKPEIILQPKNEELTKLLKERKSADSFSGVVTLEEVFSLFYHATKEINKESGSRAYPSGGGLYPLETYYLHTKNQDTFPSGLYHFNHITEEFSFIKNKVPDNLENLISIKEDLVKSLSGIIIFTYCPHRNISKYGWLGVRLALIEAGIIGQNISLVATSLSLATRFIGQIDNEKINSFLEIDGYGETSLVAIAIGK